MAGMSFFTFVAYGNLFRIEIVLKESEWEIKEIRTTGKVAFDLVNRHIPNYDVKEAADFVENIGRYIA
jgi:hypothetical protein